MSSPKLIELGGIEAGKDAHNVSLNQSYFDISASTWPPIRMSNGDAHVQSTYTGKIGSVITGLGWNACPWAHLDITQPHLLKCGAVKSVSSTVNALSIPSKRRTDADFVPFGVAIVDGAEIASPLVMVGDTATITAVTNASQYIAYYYPEIEVFFKLKTGNDLGLVEYDWEIEAEET